MRISGWRRRILASTRGKILTLLRAKNQTVNELAEALELTDNGVRSHLTSLERDVFFHPLGVRPGFRKPHVLYSLTAEAASLFSTAYGPSLHHVLTVTRRRLSLEEWRASLCEVGRTVAKEHLEQVKGKTRSQRIEGALEALK